MKGKVDKSHVDLEGRDVSVAGHVSVLILSRAESSKHQTYLVLLRNRSCVGVSAACTSCPLYACFCPLLQTQEHPELHSRQNSC